MAQSEEVISLLPAHEVPSMLTLPASGEGPVVHWTDPPPQENERVHPAALLLRLTSAGEKLLQHHDVYSCPELRSSVVLVETDPWPIEGWRHLQKRASGLQIMNQ